MENQHKRIVGVRDLTEKEVNRVNKVKGIATIVGSFMEDMGEKEGVDTRLLAIAKTNLQTGFMFAQRAVEKPTSF